jgi:flagellar protein FlaG
MQVQNTNFTDYSGAVGTKTASDGVAIQSVKTESVQEQSIKITSEAKQKDLKQELIQLTEDLNKEMNPLNINVRFGFDDKIDELSVSVYEKDSNKLLRKIPSDEAVALMSKMREIIGIIFDKKA